VTAQLGPQRGVEGEQETENGQAERVRAVRHGMSRGAYARGWVFSSEDWG
jgi:hypothetical protein